MDTANNPVPRANHCSAVVHNRLFVFGGWDGIKRLNDLYVLDTTARVLTWQQISRPDSL